MSEIPCIPKISKPVLSYFISLLALGVGEYHELCILLWVGIISTIITLIFTVITLLAHCIYYWKNKVCKYCNGDKSK